MDEFFEIGALPRQRPRRPGRLQHRSARGGDRPDAREPRGDQAAAAPGCALDLHRFGNGARALQGDARRNLPPRGGSRRRSGPVLRLISNPTTKDKNMLDTVKNAPVNGLDLAALGANGRSDRTGCRPRPRRLPRHHPLDRPDPQRDRWSTASTSAASAITRSHKIVADEPCELLGRDTAPNPQELLMAAFNACIMVGYVAGAVAQGHQARLGRDRDQGRARPARLPRPQRRRPAGL